MESHPNRTFVHRQSSLLSLLCLVVFLPYLFLPAVYYSHLIGALLPAFQEDHRAGPLAIGTHPEKPPGPYHDNNSCPICRASSNFQDYGFFSLPQFTNCATQVRLTALISPTLIIVKSEFWFRDREPRPFFCNSPASQASRFLRFLPGVPLGDPGISLTTQVQSLCRQSTD